MVQRCSASQRTFQLQKLLYSGSSGQIKVNGAKRQSKYAGYSMKGADIGCSPGSHRIHSDLLFGSPDSFWKKRALDHTSGAWTRSKFRFPSKTKR